MREPLPEDRGPHFRVWGRPALPRSPGLAQAARPPPDSFRRAVARHRSSSSERSSSGGAAPIRVDLSREASSSLPFYSLPAIQDFGHQFLRLDHVHGITILAQNSTIRSHRQLHPFCSIQVNPEPEFRIASGSSSQSLWPTPSRRRPASRPPPGPAGLGKAAWPPPRADHL